MSKKNDDLEESKRLSKSAFIGASDETIQRYGSAAKEHFVSYSGIDNESGKVLTKGLKSISVLPDTQNAKK